MVLTDAHGTIPKVKHKRKGPKSTRSGCLLCKPHKHQANTGASRRRRERAALRHEERAA